MISDQAMVRGEKFGWVWVGLFFFFNQTVFAEECLDPRIAGICAASYGVCEHLESQDICKCESQRFDPNELDCIDGKASAPSQGPLKKQVESVLADFLAENHKGIRPLVAKEVDAILKGIQEAKTWKNSLNNKVLPKHLKIIQDGDPVAVLEVDTVGNLYIDLVSDEFRLGNGSFKDGYLSLDLAAIEAKDSDHSLLAVLVSFLTSGYEFRQVEGGLNTQVRLSKEIPGIGLVGNPVVFHRNRGKDFVYPFRNKKTDQGSIFYEVSFRMPLYRNGPLSRFMSTEGSSWTREEAIQILLEITKFMEVIHSKGAIHGDFKANNIVWEKKDGKARLVPIDFDAFKEIGNLIGEEGLRNYFEEYTTKELIAPEIKKTSIGPEVTLRNFQAAEIFGMGLVFHGVMEKVLNSSPVRWWCKSAASYKVGSYADLCKVCGILCVKSDDQQAAQETVSKPSEQPEKMIYEMLNPDPMKRPQIGEIRNTLEGIVKK